MTETPDARPADRRSSPFCYQTHDALDLIRETFHGSARSTALAIYLTFTEVANRNGGASARGGFRATRKLIATHAGVGLSTLDRYVATFENVGLIEVTREKAGEVNLPNRWALVDVPSVAAPLAPLRGDPPPAGSAPRARSFSGEEETLGETPPTPSGMEVVVREPNRPVKVDRRPVTDDEYAVAAGALAAFNERAGTRYASADWIGKIVLRVRDHPALPVAAHAVVIDAAFRDPWWTGPPSPSVVYGNAALFERCLHAAANPAETAATVTADDASTFGVVWGPGTPYATAADARAAAVADHDAAIDADHWEIHDA
jgi:hypothetical protein